MSDATTRRAVRDDGERLGDLWEALLREQAALDDRFVPAADARVRWENDFPAWLRGESRRLFVAELDGRVEGFISAQRFWPPPIYEGGEEVYVDELYVVPERRGEGLGEALVAAVRSWAREIGAIRLRFQALEANTDGRAFWESQGARPFATTLLIDIGPSDNSPGASRKGRLGF